MQRESLSLSLSFPIRVLLSAEENHGTQHTHTTSQQLHQHTEPSSLFVKKYRRPQTVALKRLFFLSLSFSLLFLLLLLLFMCYVLCRVE